MSRSWATTRVGRLLKGLGRRLVRWFRAVAAEDRGEKDAANGAAQLLSGELGVRVGVGKAEGKVEGKVEGAKTMSVLVENSYSPTSEQIDGRVVERSVWYRDDRFFGQKLSERMSGGLKDCRFERSLEDDFGIDASLDLSALETAGVKIGGKFQSHVAGKWVIQARF